ncbi:MAG: Fe-S cluster assembly protein SufD [Bacteroidetes bacterium]|nr:MAG: Fe-S cluster assembly protein SufD [Bacteroidota bacterium]PIE88369.1 MAG: Fe-S cluster assembly protein SufD [Bacteroidota bacterium]
MYSKNNTITERITSYFEAHKQVLFQNDTPQIKRVRQRAFEAFVQQGLPDKELESWKNTDIRSTLEQDFRCSPEPENRQMDVEAFFKCKMPNFDTLMVTTLNGYHVYHQSPLKQLDNGVVVGSFAEAKKHYPQLFTEYFGTATGEPSDGLVALNTAMAGDGVFVYIPDNVIMEESIQIVNLHNSNEKLFSNIRNLIIVGENSRVRIVHCDDSYSRQAAFCNTLTEVIVEKGGSVDHYKLQNLNNVTSLNNQVFVLQRGGSEVVSNSITFNGGLVRNYTHTTLSEPESRCNIMGLYLVDKTQHIDNQVLINHDAPNCYSNELFKGLVDDRATAVFNGHIRVKKDAQKTIAYQNSKNLLLSEKANAIAKPFLEIYADDVKCSHGATVGQLDREALFYLRSRGISEANAKILLRYAFAAEIINEITIENLKDQIDDMMKKRLNGELDICETCVLHCNTKDHEVTFPIDLSKI